MQQPPYPYQQPIQPQQKPPSRAGKYIAIGCGLLLAGGLATAGLIFGPDLVKSAGPTRPTAMQVCLKLIDAGVARGCAPGKPGGLGGGAVEQVVFDLPSVPGKTAQILRYDRDDAFEQADKAFLAAVLFVGPHRYGNAKARIFLQMNEGASMEVGQKAKAVIDGL